MYLQDLYARRISKATIAKWRERWEEMYPGDDIVRQPDTKEAFVITDDVFELFKSWRPKK